MAELLQKFLIFDKFTLSQDDIYFFATIFTAALCGIFACGKVYCGSDRKKVSWILTLVNSFLMSNLGALYLMVKLPNIISTVFYGTEAQSYMNALDNFSVMICLWFALVNLFDLIFGFIFYRELLDPITALVHHPLYIWMMIASTTGHGGFINPKVFAPAFVMATVEELPTFILALGSVSKSMRSDMAFGVTFLVLRLFYHSLLLIFVIYIEMEPTPIALYVLTLVMHLFWFNTWFKKYGKKIFFPSPDKPSKALPDKDLKDGEHND